jgi:hypothetical protein
VARQLEFSVRGSISTGVAVWPAAATATAVKHRRASFALLVCAAAFGLTGCVPSPSATPSTFTPGPSTTTVSPDELVDPLSEITDPESDVFIDQGLTPLIHEQQTGAATVPIRIDQSVTAVEFFISCAPISEFEITLGGLSYSGGCLGVMTGSGTIPVSSPAPTAVMVDVPDGVKYWLVAIPGE